MKLLSTHAQTPNEWAPWVKTGDRVFYLLSSYNERQVPKDAGWAFAKDTKKLWFTTDYDKACRLADYADGDLHKELSAQKIALATNEEKSRKESSDIVLVHPEELDYKPFQYAGIDFMLSSDKPGILLGDDMGLGKTIQIIGLYNNCEKIKNVLIICPNTLKLNWLREFQKWDCRGGKHAIADTKICPLPEHGYNVVIINYEAVPKQNARLSSIKWDLIGVDEAHYLKNDGNLRNKAIFGSEKYKPIDRHLIVFATGTPIPNRVMEMWALISRCDPDRWNHNTQWKFISKYCGGKPKGAATDDKLNELQRILRQTIMVRRLKKDVLKELPPKMRQVIELEYSSDDKLMIAALNHEKLSSINGEEAVFNARVRVEVTKAEDNEEEYKAAIANLSDIANIAFQDMAKARYEVAVAKLPYVIKMLENALGTVNKIVVFAHHKDILNTIAKHFGSSAVMIHGDVKLQQRQEAVDRFQHDTSVRVAVMSIKAAGVGITLTASSTVYFAELDWVPGNMIQCEDRCLRIGQESDIVNIYQLVVDGSIDVKMAHSMIQKMHIAEQTLDKTSAYIPVLPGDDEPATSVINRIKIEEELKTFDISLIPVIMEGLQVVAGYDTDYARAKNDMGFNAIDTRIGHDLASKGYLTPKQAILAKKILKKYRKQIPFNIYYNIFEGGKIEEY